MQSSLSPVQKIEEEKIMFLISIFPSEHIVISLKLKMEWKNSNATKL